MVSTPNPSVQISYYIQGTERGLFCYHSFPMHSPGFWVRARANSSPPPLPTQLETAKGQAGPRWTNLVRHESGDGAS